MGNKMRLEFISVRPEILKETIDEKTQDRSMRVRMKWQHADIVNRNNRVYPKQLLQREMDNIQEGLVEGAVFGASYHPKGADAEVNDVAIIWHKTWMEEDGSCMGEGTILPTTNGKDAQIIIKAGGRIGISSRGTGSVSKVTRDGKQIEQVNNDYKMLSPGDMVLTPSVPGASVRAMIEKHVSASYFSEEDDTMDEQNNSSGDSKSIENEVNDMEKKFMEFETEEDYQAHLTEKMAEFLTSADFNKAVKVAVEAQKEEWTKAITADLEPKIEAVQKEQTEMIEKIRDAVNGLSAIPGVIPVEEEAEEGEEKVEKVDEDLKKKIKDLEKTIADMKQVQDDKEADTKKKKENEELGIAIMEAVKKELEKDEYKAYKPLIEGEMVVDGAVIGVETVEAVEEAVKATHIKLSELKVKMEQAKIIESGTESVGTVENVDTKNTSAKEAEAILKERFESSKSAGFSGNFEAWKKTFVK